MRSGRVVLWNEAVFTYADDVMLFAASQQRAPLHDELTGGWNRPASRHRSNPPKSANSLKFKGNGEKIAVISQANVYLYPAVWLSLLEPL